MSIKRIIFLSQDRFSTRNHRRFGIQQLEEHGFKVEFLECSPTINPKFFQAFTPTDAIDFPELKLFHSKKPLFNVSFDILKLYTVFPN